MPGKSCGRTRGEDRIGCGDGIGRGVALRVSPNGTKTWAYRYKQFGKRRRVTLGEYPVMSLADARAMADKGVRVNAVAPGTIATELAAKAVLTSDEAKAKIMSRTPMKRLGEPSEIADAVAYLASDAASYITGEIVVVDGGRMTLNYTVP